MPADQLLPTKCSGTLRSGLSQSSARAALSLPPLTPAAACQKTSLDLSMRAAASQETVQQKEASAATWFVSLACMDAHGQVRPS